ncbi:organic solvent tolerance protein [Candidatus Pelagibacter ubique]|nr:organic solvent tolerance protein [Candidatus Pelagibacter ubique]
MKNRIIIIFLILIFNISPLSFANSDEFTFEVTDLEILENNTVYKGNNRGKVVTDTQVELMSDNFIYLKKINRLETNGNVELTDIKNNITINADKMFYLKSEEIIYTVGKTLVNVDGQYNVVGSDLTFLKNEMILMSNNKTNITDINSNVYKLDQFEYSINDEVLKGERVFYRRNEQENKEDEYYFETGFFNLKKSEFLGTSTEITFHKTLFDNEENDPRIKGVASYGDKYNAYLDKAVFTSCKKTDKCPPWKMTAKNVQHDKIKKQIIYRDAWLELYDYPVAYFPKFFHPDPTVDRQSGLLRPAIGDNETLGDSIYLPYFFVISDDKDITLKPRLFNDNKILLQTEYRQKTKNSLTVIDSSITKGHYSDKNNKTDKDTRSHFFSETKINLDFKDFISSTLAINYQKISNDTYLKVFDFIEGSLFEKAPGTLTSKIELDLAHEDYDFGSSLIMYESLEGKNSDRYTYVLPDYSISRNFFLSNFEGSFSASSAGNHSINNTNISSTLIDNSLSYSSLESYTDSGIVSDYNIEFRNSNTMSDNSLKYKNTPQSEFLSAYFFDVKFPLQKKTKDRQNTLMPKLNFRISPHDMKKNANTSAIVNIGNVFSTNRIGMIETGESLTLGVDFKKQKINQVSKIVEIDGVRTDFENLTNSKIENQLKEDSTFTKEMITEIEDYIDFSLATVFRFNKEENIPLNSTINEKTSNIFGSANYKPNKNISLGYNFSLTNDLNTLEQNSISAEYLSENFSTTFNFSEEAGILGDTNVISNVTKLIDFKEYHNLSFSTRRNRKINLTEYYDILYQYKNDCLVAEIKYRKDYYSDNDLIPKEELFFAITIVPFYTFSPDKMILQKDGGKKKQ